MMQRLALGVLAALSPAPALAETNVECVQAFLAETAFDPGPVDGQWGRRTGNAVESFFRQADVEVEGGFGQGNAARLCAIFTEDTDSTLKEAGLFRRYAITLDPAILADIDPAYFDFSAYERYSGPDLSCLFSFYTDIRSGAEVWERVKGNVKIIEGRLVFGDHRYEIGYEQLSDVTYLQERSNLMLLSSGQIVGRTPYFWDYIQQGQVARKPVDATLSFKYAAGSTFPNGSSYFKIPEYADIAGILELKYCR